jgi:transcriptional regulator with XRE-family HTH domain
MKIDTQHTDVAILQEIGARLARQRIEAGHTQAALAEQAGIAKRTLERIEAGHGAELVTLIRVLRALELTDGLENLIREPPPSPIALLKQQSKQRRRAARPRAKASVATGKPWTWRE